MDEILGKVTKIFMVIAYTSLSVLEILLTIMWIASFFYFFCNPFKK